LAPIHPPSGRLFGPSDTTVHEKWEHVTEHKYA
jgi:hypothetical protein